MTKFGCLNINSGGDTAMGSDPKYYHTTNDKLIQLCSLYIIIRTHHSISAAINIDTTKFGHNLLQDPIPLNINFNCIPYLI